MAGLEMIVLGAAAGGGFPQWNRGGSDCADARAGRLPATTRSSLAVFSAHARDGAIIDASPDIGRQTTATPALRPTGPRTSPLKSPPLNDDDIDHVDGLLILREIQLFDLWAAADIGQALAANPVLSPADADLVPRRTARPEAPFELLPGLTATLFAAPGKPPLCLEGDEAALRTDVEVGRTVGVLLEASGRRAMIAPGRARMTPALAARVEGADPLFFGGAMWEDDEMIRRDQVAKTGRRMGHMSISSPDGSIAALDDVPVGRRIHVHVNNSGPAIRPDGPDRRALEAAGRTLAQDGMEFRA